MKIASRFPVKDSNGLLSLIIVLHLTVLIASVQIHEFLIQYSLVIISLFISFYYSLKQLKRITKAPDDLCWTGEQWMMRVLNDENQLSFQETAYLEILESSWVTSQFCLLKFQSEPMLINNSQYTWFFSSGNLGDRTYRELCFLVKQSIRAKIKINDEKSR